MDIRKRLFPQKVFEQWNRLPRKMITAPKPSRVPEAFGQHSHKHAVGFSECPVRGQKLDYMILVGPLQLSIFYHDFL